MVGSNFETYIQLNDGIGNIITKRNANISTENERNFLNKNVKNIIYKSFEFK